MKEKILLLVIVIFAITAETGCLVLDPEGEEIISEKVILNER